MMQALGYKDLLSGGCYQRGGANAPANPTTPTTQQPQTGNVMQGSFSYKSSVEVSFSNDAMQMAYSQKTEVSFSFSQSVGEVSRPSAADSMQSPETSAKNILKFVEDKLKSLKASGASPEEMKKALDDGLKGYETGRDQAVDILKGYGMYDGPVKTGVEQTTDLVKKGIEELGKTYLGTGETTTPTTPAPTQTETKAPTTTTPVTDSTATTKTPTTTKPTKTTDDAASSVSRYRTKMYTEQKLDLTVQTRDGDTVTISIAALQKMQGDGSLSSFKGMSEESSLFQVDGELDDDEKAALDDLVGNIMDLADSFYGGDMADAMDKAAQLSLDPKELASMSLEMTQTQYMRASAASYRDVAGYGADGVQGTQRNNGGSNNGLSGLADYVKSLQELADKAVASVKSPREFINELFAATFAQLDAAQQKQNPLGVERTDSLHRQIVDGALQPKVDGEAAQVDESEKAAA